MIINKIRNNSKIFLQHLFKSYVEGIYSDSFLNRKLGRVGTSYKIRTIDNPDNGGGNIINWDEINKLDKNKTLTIDKRISCVRYLNSTYQDIEKNGEIYFITKYPNIFIRKNTHLWSLIIDNKVKGKPLDIKEVFNRLRNQGIKKDKEKEKLEALIDDLDKEIKEIQYQIDEKKVDKEGWEEVLKIKEEGTEEYQRAEEKIQECEDFITSYIFDINEKEDLQKKYKVQLEERKDFKNKKIKDYESSILKEVEKENPGVSIKPYEYARKLTAAEQNHDRDLE